MESMGAPSVTILEPVLTKDPIFCPWGFMNVDLTQNQHSSPTMVEETTTNKALSDDMLPGRQGEYPTITIEAEEVDKGLDFCKLALVGRLDMSKLTMTFVNEKVKQVWNPSHEWQAEKANIVTGNANLDKDTHQENKDSAPVSPTGAIPESTMEHHQDENDEGDEYESADEPEALQEVEGETEDLQIEAQSSETST
ncbi:hypothetical protein IFM89_006382 [Coptis chinensis]|uniref:Uncharacterized protein n=1 Tax=Coptis chinensis TaxID=261450 RepID=A0A835LR35_9MAGN|nr:hypothetical protein IFM89_006382 [Coptis chinensis]